MIRGRQEESQSPAAITRTNVDSSDGVAFPDADQPYATSERPFGVLFYQGRESFFLPYHLLQSMHYQPERIALRFATDDVVLGGRGLHEVYALLAAQRVCRVVEQGQRYAQISDAPLFVATIERIPRSTNEGGH